MRIIHFDLSFKTERWYLRFVLLSICASMCEELTWKATCELSGYQQEHHYLLVTAALLSLIQHAINIQ